MAKVYESIPADIQAFIEAQAMFFVATAPLGGDGHINLSPKGLDSFRVLTPTRVAYLDLTGSGNETSAHLRENGRITFMFCAFEGGPSILRLYGRGQTLLAGSPQYQELAPRFPSLDGARQIIVADIERVQSSCGEAVPRMQLLGQRENLLVWARAKGDAGLDRYRRTNNARSIDGLPSDFGAEVGEKAGEKTGEKAGEEAD